MDGDTPTIGSFLSLTSKSEIRYEGLLDSVDADTNTVTLRDVRIRGTEGRARGGNEVPSSEQVYANIVFRGSDIRNLTVFKQPHGDPAIVSSQPGRAGNNRPAARDFYDEAPSTQHARGGGGYQGNRRHNNNDNYHHGGYRGRGGRGGGRGGGYHRGGGGGGYRGRRGGRGGHAHTGMEFEAADDSRKERFKEDFDFEKSREEFEKKKDEFHKAKEEAKKDSTYDKSADFFDTISCDQKDQRNPRQDRDDMKRADQETFGADMVGNMRFRRGGGGRGRGGRGRFNRY